MTRNRRRTVVMLFLAATLNAAVCLAAPKLRTADEQKVRELTYLRKDIRLEAARYLGENQVYSAMEPLSKALQTDTETEVRAQAAWALGECCAARAALTIAKAAMEDKDAAVRREAIWALNYMEGARKDIAASVIPAVRWISLNDPSELVREKAAIILGMLKPAGVNTTLQQMFDKEPSVTVRARIAKVLGENPSEKARLTLNKALDDSAELVVLEARSALAKLPPGCKDARADAEVKVETRKPLLGKPAAKAAAKKAAPRARKQEDIPELAVATTDFIFVPEDVPDVPDAEDEATVKAQPEETVDMAEQPPAKPARKKPAAGKNRKTAARKSGGTKKAASAPLPLPEEPAQP